MLYATDGTILPCLNEIAIQTQKHIQFYSLSMGHVA